MKSRFRDNAGVRFGQLVAQWPVGRRGRSARIVWLCVCDCGALALVYTNHLKTGATISCGCVLTRLLVDRNRHQPPGLRHGHARHGALSREYSTWRGMIQRCTNPNASKYKYYGGLGVTVCERWRTFENFLADMGQAPKGRTLDRFPNNAGDYEPGNVRWATCSEQAHNLRKKAA
jgi:hypothetical protein